MVCRLTQSMLYTHLINIPIASVLQQQEAKGAEVQVVARREYNELSILFTLCFGRKHAARGKLKALQMTVSASIRGRRRPAAACGQA